MFTILGADGKEYGPVTAGKIAEWIAGGRANLQTKARRADETEWKTLGDYPEFGLRASSGPDEQIVVPPPATATAVVAAEPAVPRLEGSPSDISARLAPQAASFDLFACLSRSFALWTGNFLPLVGVTLLALIVQLVANMIPLLGILSSLLLTGVFTGGIYYYYIGKIRGEPRDVGDIFAGFSKAFLPLLLTGLLLNLISFALLALFFGPIFVALFSAALTSTPESFQFPALSGAAAVWMAVGLIPLLYLNVCWVFAYALVIDQGLGPWTALEVSRRVVSRRWFSMFFLLICAGILGMLGIIGLGVGVIFTIPLAFGAILYAYEDLCRPAA
jgi:uncharacterized membrane protein